MAYSDFTLSKVRAAFDLTIEEVDDLFALVPTFEPSDFLARSIKENLPLATASNTGKARSELYRRCD